MGTLNKVVNTTVSASDVSFHFCQQDMLRTEGNPFPALPSNQPEGQEWMKPVQESVSVVAGWTSVGVIVFVFLTFVWGWMLAVRSLFSKPLEDDSSPTHRTFHQVMHEGSISTYIPQVESPLFSYPLLACDTSEIDDQIYDFTDPDRPHSSLDLTKDAAFLCGGIGLDLRHGFSHFKHYERNFTFATSTSGGSDSYKKPPKKTKRKSQRKKSTRDQPIDECEPTPPMTSPESLASTPLKEDMKNLLPPLLP